MASNQLPVSAMIKLAGLMDEMQNLDSMVATRIQDRLAEVLVRRLGEDRASGLLSDLFAIAPEIRDVLRDELPTIASMIKKL